MPHFIETRYCNPLIEEPWADPAVAGPDEHGFWWCYATDDEGEPPPVRRFKVARSNDLVTWETHPPGAERGAFPGPIANQGRHRACWAPDVRRLGPGDWRFYGSLKFDDHADEGPMGFGIIGARGSGPLGFAEPTVMARGPGFATIDPCFFRSSRTGQDYLFWGSGHGPILGQELRRDGLGFAPGSRAQVVLLPEAGERLWEGVHVLENPRTGDPVFLVSGSCTWNGPYRTVVFEGGRHPLDAARRLPGRAPLLTENTVWNRCGQVFTVTDAVGQHWIYYHAVRGASLIPGTQDMPRTGGGFGIPLRQLCLDRLLFDEAGLPYVEGDGPSWADQPGPVLRVSS